MTVRSHLVMFAAAGIACCAIAVPVSAQITTGTVCHLDAEMINAALERWPLESLDVLFIENVGNLVCPASYDLGEALRVVLLSVTEGEDKPLKYPTIFNSADLALITKIDLADVVGFDRDAAHEAINTVRPGLDVLEVSARTESGLEPWLARLRAARHAIRIPIANAVSATPGSRHAATSSE